MEQVWRVLSTIELLSDNNSFKLGIVRSVENLWILNHFKHLKIKSHKVRYKSNYGYRQRKTTVYPKRWLRKKFKNTTALISYLNNKPYDISVFELEFTNNWRIKVGMYTEITFYTNSTKERNDLIIKLLSIEGIDANEKSINKLIQNFTYWINLSGEFVVFQESHAPDEFWSEEQINVWRRKYYSQLKANDIKDSFPFDEAKKSKFGSNLFSDIDDKSPF
tara:strand:+ start:1535 stop:2194 length:660 start_codon:yes stop_codon:yes gene_type:complete